MLRRAMGKKKAEEMAEHRTIFSAGAAKNGISKELADEIFDVMEKFAGYGFNKSHAAAYALLAYHTAWLKVHYTAEFFAGNMTVSPPDVNQGAWRFIPLDNKTICYALGAVKGTGQGAIEALVRERTENGPFKSFFDFCARVDRKQVNKRVVEALIKAGAFDSLEPHRAALLASASLAFEYADALLANADQGGLFDFGDSHAASTNEAEPEVRRFAKQRIGDLRDSREPQVVAGIISELRVINGTRGRVGLFKLDDKSESIEAVANQDTLDANKELLKDDELVIITGKVQTDRFSGGLRLNVQSVMSLAAARCRYARFVRVLAKDQKLPVADILREFPARQIEAPQPDLPPTVQGLPIRVVVERRTLDVSARAEVELGDKARLFPSDQALQRFKELMPEGQAMVVYGEG